MGIIKAVAQAVGGGLADQWLEVFEADDMGGNTVFTSGVKLNRKNANMKATDNTVSNGSIIHVYPNQFMLLVDGGKIIDYTAEEGYYEVKDSSMPSLFNGEFGETLKESFGRIKFGGSSSKAQKVYFINTQEIKGQKFGTANPLNYFDNFYNAELFLRCHGNYSIKVTDPIKFYAEVIPKNASKVNFEEISEQYLSEFLEALQAAINQMSVDGERISFITSKGRELSAYMATTLDDSWKEQRGFEIQSVGIANISYSDESQQLINMRNQGAMFSDAKVREGFVQTEVAKGIAAAGSNTAGAGAAFMGMGIGMNAGGAFMGSASATNAQQMQMEAAAQNQTAAAGAVGAAGAAGATAGWICECGTKNTGRFCSNCGKPQPSEWVCECGTKNSGKFCSNCGKPQPSEWTCECGAKNTGKFCSNCGKERK